MFSKVTIIWSTYSLIFLIKGCNCFANTGQWLESRMSTGNLENSVVGNVSPQMSDTYQYSR